MSRDRPGDRVTKGEKARRVHADLYRVRQTWEPTWREIARFLAPKRGRFDDAEPHERGGRDDTEIYKMTPARALRTFSAGLHSGVTNPSRPWMRLTPGDPDRKEDARVRAWLDDVEKILYRIFARSNLYHVLPSLYTEFGGFGTGAMIVEEDYDTVIRCRPFTVGEYALAQDAAGRVNRFARKLWMTCDQLVEKFGYDAVPYRVRQAYDARRFGDWFRVNHLVEPNDGRDTSSKLAREMPWRNLYWLEGESEEGFLLDGGYEEFPVLAPRWETVGSSSYGVESPGWVGIGDAKMLQTQVEDWLEASDLALHPPVNAPASMQGAGVSLLSGAINYVPDGMGEGIRPVGNLGLDLNAAWQGIQATQQDLREAFFVDLFLMFQGLDGTQRTAREIVERSTEKLLMLGPMLQRTYSELLDPLIDRTFAIAWRAGILPPPPPDMEGEEIRVEYISVLAQAQKMVGTTSLEQFAGFVGNVASVQPDALDKLDVDQLIDEYADALGVPSTITRSDEVVALLRKERQEQAAQAQAMEMAAQGAKIARDVGDVKVGPNSALEAIMPR